MVRARTMKVRTKIFLWTKLKQFHLLIQTPNFFALYIGTRTRMASCHTRRQLKLPTLV